MYINPQTQCPARGACLINDNRYHRPFNLDLFPFCFRFYFSHPETVGCLRRGGPAWHCGDPALEFPGGWELAPMLSVSHPRCSVNRLQMRPSARLNLFVF